MYKLITFDIQQNIKPISKNNQNIYLQLQKEVIEFELEQLLGTLFYNDVINNYNPNNVDKYKELVEGSTFTDCNGNTQIHKGLQYYLAYMIYSKYILVSNVNDTFTGLVQKTRQDSENVSFGQLKNIEEKSRQIAFNYYDKTRQFIEVNKDIFTTYCKYKENRTKSVIFTGIKKTKF